MSGEQWIGNDLEGNGRDLMELLSLYLLGGIKENQETTSG
jgi:hypothetical protein